MNQDEESAAGAPARFEDDPTYGVLVFWAWILGGAAFLSALRVLQLMYSHDGLTVQIGVFVMLSVFLLVGSAVCAVYCFVRGAELRVVNRLT